MSSSSTGNGSRLIPWLMAGIALLGFFGGKLYANAFETPTRAEMQTADQAIEERVYRVMDQRIAVVTEQLVAIRADQKEILHLLIREQREGR